MKSKLAKLKTTFRDSFLDNTVYDGFDVTFSNINEGINCHIEGTYEFHLMGASPYDCLVAVAKKSGDDFVFDQEECEIKAYCHGTDEACASFEGFRSLYANEATEDQAERFGIELAEALNSAIGKIIDHSRKKRLG